MARKQKQESRTPDVGDRVTVTREAGTEAPMRRARPDLVGQQGEIVENNGWGLCRVEMDGGEAVRLWNAADLELVARRTR